MTMSAEIIALAIGAVVVVISAARFVSFLALRRARREWLRLASDLKSDPRFDVNDKVWLQNYVDDTRSRWFFVFVSALSPIWLPVLAIVFLYETVRDVVFRGLSYDQMVNQMTANAETEHAELMARIEGELSGVDPREGGLWDDKRRRQLAELSTTIEIGSNPVALTWLTIWIVLTSPIWILSLFIFGLQHFRSATSLMKQAVENFARRVEVMLSNMHRPQPHPSAP